MRDADSSRLVLPGQLLLGSAYHLPGPALPRGLPPAAVHALETRHVRGCPDALGLGDAGRLAGVVESGARRAYHPVSQLHGELLPAPGRDANRRRLEAAPGSSSSRGRWAERHGWAPSRGTASCRTASRAGRAMFRRPDRMRRLAPPHHHAGGGRERPADGVTSVMLRTVSTLSMARGRLGGALRWGSPQPCSAAASRNAIGLASLQPPFARVTHSRVSDLKRSGALSARTSSEDCS